MGNRKELQTGRGYTFYMSRFSKIIKTATRVRRAVSVIVPNWMNGKPEYSMINFDGYRREGYLRNELIYACLTAKADTTASVSLKVYSKKDHEEIEDHPLRTLLSMPNPMMSESEMWK